MASTPLAVRPGKLLDVRFPALSGFSQTPTLQGSVSVSCFWLDRSNLVKRCFNNILVVQPKGCLAEKERE